MMRMGRRVQRLAVKAAPKEGRIVIVYEAEAGVWTTYDGARVERADLPATAQVIVFRRSDGGPQ